VPVREAVTISLSVAVVIMAETLLAENNFAQKNGYRINDNQEILAFAMGNLAAALTGCCPINGSVSRTAMGAVSGKDTADRDCGGTFDDRAPHWRNRVYRLSSGAGADGNRDLRSAWRDGV
jgi:hypothetical protein